MRITEAACRKLEKLGCHLYLSLELGGCEEYKYKFSLTPFDLEPKEYVFDLVRVFIPASQVQKLGGIELDFESNLVRSGFTIKENPSIKEKCRCGISFR